MLKINVMGRATGKTTKVIEMMQENEDLILIVPITPAKEYFPESLHNRIYTFHDFKNGVLRSKRIKEVVLDEGFSYRKDELAELYYWLGFNKVDVTSYGTI